MWNADAAFDVVCSKLVIRNKLSKEQGRPSAHQTYLTLTACIDLDSIPLRQCLSALLSYLSVNIFNMDDGMITVADINPLPNMSFMRIDAGSLRYNQII